ncbi:MAG TPA: RluA family pseudouridine synthase [Polyangiaceae bacterium]|nr:RluA family pseudouridine synthase [Polyangiaceae bacterium]
MKRREAPEWVDPVERVVDRASSGARVDRFVAGSLEVSRSEVQRWIEEGRVTVDGTARDASARVREGERVLVRPAPRRATIALPDESVEFEVLHVDDEVVVLNKPPGLVVHPARGHESGTLVNGLLARGLFRRDALEGAGEDGAGGENGDADERDAAHVRPGIVHRLDKGTSGVMVVARTAFAREALKAQFQAHSIERAYEAIVVGRAAAQTISTMHGRHPRDRLRFTTRVTRGKHAVTHVRVLAPLRGATHVECTLETGRTHQIRVHLAESGTPVLGDPLYGKPPRDPETRAVAERLGHQALHARLLGFIHPGTQQRVRFEAPPPADFGQALAALR